jgi:hypothetical protein
VGGHNVNVWRRVRYAFQVLDFFISAKDTKAAPCEPRRDVTAGIKHE